MGSINPLNVHSISVPRQDNGYDCGMFVCAYAEMILKDCQEVFQLKEKSDGDDGISKIRQDKSVLCICTVMESLKKKEKREWFTSQHVTKMRAMVKEQIYEMARAQQREEEEEKTDVK